MTYNVFGGTLHPTTTTTLLHVYTFIQAIILLRILIVYVAAIFKSYLIYYIQ